MRWERVGYTRRVQTRVGGGDRAVGGRRRIAMGKGRVYKKGADVLGCLDVSGMAAPDGSSRRASAYLHVWAERVLRCLDLGRRRPVQAGR